MKRRIFWTEVSFLAFFALVGALFVMSTIEVNAVQRRWELIAVAWELVVFAVPMVFLQPIFRGIEPYARRLEEGGALGESELATYQRLVLGYPLKVSLTCLLGSIFAYSLLALQLRFLAALAWEEVILIHICGVVSGLLWAVVEYFLIEHYVRPLTGPVAEHSEVRVAVPLSAKIFACSIALVTSALGFFAVTAYGRAAHIVEGQAAERLQAIVQEIANLTAELPLSEDGKLSDLWWTLATEYRVSPRGYIHLIDTSGKIIHTHPATEGLGLGYLQNENLLPEVLDEILRSREGKLVDRVGWPKIIAYELVPDNQWKLVAIAPRSDFTVYLQNFIYAGLAAMAFSFLFALGIGLLSARSITTPLAEVTRAAQKVAGARDLHERVRFLTNDEVGALGKAFNEMAEELQSYAGGLEQLVAERTRELELRGEQLQAKNLELSDFLYVVSHDLRAPLINLEGFSRALQDSLNNYDQVMHAACEGSDGAPLPPAVTQWPDVKQEIEESLEFILRSVKKMDLLAKGLLELSRIETRPHLPQRIDVGKMVHEILGSLKYQITQRKVTVEVGDLPVVRGDPVRLNQVFSNLVDNAIKYMKPEGEARIEIGCQDRGDFYLFHVRDTGLGIRPEDRAKVFRLFTRLGANSVQGEGIGLAAVRKIVERHGGRIWVDSEPGEGSTFYFTLPRPSDTEEERTEDDGQPGTAQDSAH